LRPLSQAGTRLGLLMLLAAFFVPVAALAQSGAPEGGSSLEEPTAGPAVGYSDVDADTGAEGQVVERLVVLPFRIHSARPLSYLTESLGELLAGKLEAAGDIEIIGDDAVQEALGSRSISGLSDSDRRDLGERLEADAVISGSLTELAGSFSLDVRVTPSASGARSHSIVLATENEEALLARLDELAGRVSATLTGRSPGVLIEIAFEGAVGLDDELRADLGFREGNPYDPDQVNRALAYLERHPNVATASVETERGPLGVSLLFKVVRAEMIFGEGAVEAGGEAVKTVEIRGNRRIEADAIRTRISTRPGDTLNASRVAGDVREVFGLGFFNDVRVLSVNTPEGVILIFEVEESPIIRQISISGNDHLDNDKVRDALTLTTGSTLDYPLLHENTDRVKSLYRAEGYYLASVGFEIEETAEGVVAIHLEVEEGEKLKLRSVEFTGNEAFSDRDLREVLSVKTWKFWSYLTSWFDRSGTYSEPIFIRDLRNVEKVYTDSGYLQVELNEPDVDANEEGLFVKVRVTEGPRFSVGEIEVSGDATIDLDELRGRIQLRRGDIFNRSFLTADVEQLESFYTDRGFYFASVNPATRLSPTDNTVDVEFQVKKGPLYFVRHVNIQGNTRTIDPVIRREMQVVEGQLYSARSLQLSEVRIRGLGFFEDVSFDAKPTEDPSQLDLEVNVVERPTGSFSFGAGYSSQDKLVFTASLSQANFLGRGYGVNLSADIGGQTTRFYLSVADPYFMGSEFSLRATGFLTAINYDDFEQKQAGFDLHLGHILSEDGLSRGYLHYGYAMRRIEQSNFINASASLWRSRLQENQSTSMLGISFNRRTLDDNLTPTSGMSYGGNLEFAGLGGFAKFVRAEGRFTWFLGAPWWLLDDSTFVVSTRLGYALPLNVMSDWDIQIYDHVTPCDDPGRCNNIARLDQIDTDLRLPLTDRYFLGGIGTFQLRGYRARSVGPRRPILKRSGLFGQGRLLLPVGTETSISSQGILEAHCNDVPPSDNNGIDNQGNWNGRCNSLGDKDIADFDDLDETDVIGGNSFISTSFEYRFPISDEVGVQGVLFVDMGNAFYEGQNLFDVTQWRYGYGGGLLWFSPFGPLQLILGFPINRISALEKSPVFEFSVGGYVP